MLKPIRRIGCRSNEGLIRSDFHRENKDHSLKA
jgi:hypothetical protein